MFSGALCDPSVMDAAIDRLTKLYVEKDEALAASSPYKCSTHPILLGLLTAVAIGMSGDV